MGLELSYYPYRHDNLNRLRTTHASITDKDGALIPGHSLSMSYDKMGNITSKSDVADGASYVYGESNHCASNDAGNSASFAIAPGPYAVTHIGNPSSDYNCYDGNGNVIASKREGKDDIHYFKYSVYDKVTHIAHADYKPPSAGGNQGRFRQTNPKNDWEWLGY